MRGGVDPAVGKATQIKPGEVRNPGGRPKGILSEAYREELKKAGADGRTMAEHIAEAQVKEAMKGKTQAADHLADRTEGKPLQAVKLEGGVSLDAGERLTELLTRAAQRARQAP